MLWKCSVYSFSSMPASCAVLNVCPLDGLLCCGNTGLCQPMLVSSINAPHHGLCFSDLYKIL